MSSGRLFLTLPLLALLTGCASSTTSPTTGTPAVARSQLERTAAANVSDADVKSAVAANNAFAVDLYAHVLADNPSGNLVTSPLSASLALTMTYAGARAETASEMASALHLGAASTSIFGGQNAMDQALRSRAAAALASETEEARRARVAAPSPSNFDLHVVNSIWGEQTSRWAQPFLDTLAASYGAGVFLQDFLHAPDDARLAINAWVSKETSDKINDLLTPGMVTSSTRMVLVNAIHFKFPWAHPFEPAATHDAPFTRADGSHVTVPMMNEQASFPYVDDGKAQIVALPLVGREEAVVIALPHGDLATYEASLAAGSAALTIPATSSEVRLSLPKTKFTSPTFSLAKALQAMGMVRAFDSRADFSGMVPSDGEQLHIDDVVQKTMLGMDEAGVEAAAATAVSMRAVAMPADPIAMVVDRPFLVSIVDVPTGAVLFLGHIQDPTQN